MEIPNTRREQRLAQVARDLEPGENMLWAGRANWLLATRSRLATSLPCLAFGVAFAAFGLMVWNGSGLYNASFFFVAGLAVVMLGLHIALEDWLSVYLITDRRAVILRQRMRVTCSRSLRPDPQTYVTADPNEAGVSDLYFGGYGIDDGPHAEAFVFVSIGSVEAVKEIAKSVVAREGPVATSIAADVSADVARMIPQLKRSIDRFLQPNERLVWLALAKPKAFGARYGSMQCFGGVALGFMLYAIGGNGSPLLCTPFLLLAAALATSPYWARLMAKRCAYFITDRRAVSFAPHVGFWPIDARTFAAGEVRVIERVEHHDGSGSLLFRTEIAIIDEDQQPHTVETGFYGVADERALLSFVGTAE